MIYARFMAMLLATALATAAHAQVAASGDPVLYWNQIAIREIGADERDPAMAGRNYAILNIALHDAINATLGSPDQSYLRGVTAPGGDTRVAAAQAAHDVLATLYPGRRAAFDAALAASTAGRTSADGKTTGQRYASAILSLRAGDGYRDSPVRYGPTGAPGNYVPTVVTPDGPIVVGTQVATAALFVLPSVGAFRPEPPPALTDAGYAAAYDEVKAIGARDSTVRTPDQTAAARFWERNPETPYLAAAIARSLASPRSVLDNARIFATLTTAIADADVVMFAAKYSFDLWRPITAIHQGDTDGNPETVGDAGWRSLLEAPPFPSYFSGHATSAGTAAAIVDHEYGPAGPFCFTNAVATRCWRSVDQAAAEDADSRLWGGIHFGFDNRIGLAVGRKVAAVAIARAVFARR